MKKVYLLMFGMSLGLTSIAQKLVPSDNVGIGTKSPDNSAVLDIQSVNKGLLIPRLTLDQRNAINSPANGLMVYQTNENSGFYFYNGKNWAPLAGNEAKSVALDVQNWSKTGDAGTNPSINFLGTTDNQPLVFRVNNLRSGFISSGTSSFIGYQSGIVNTGVFNSAFGNNSMRLNSNGQENTALGSKALEVNVSGNTNVAIGSFALSSNTASFNTAVGSSALAANTIGTNNSAFGLWSMYGNTEGSFNMAMGSYSLMTNTIGNNNLAIGTQAMRFATGSDNVGIGYNALYNTSGNGNVGIGAGAGRDNNGTGNIFIGNQAGLLDVGASNKLYISNSNTSNPLIKGDFSANTLKVNSKTTGYLAIGDFDAITPMPTPVGYRLIVQDGILSEKIKVALRTSSTDWADYVFEPEYKAKMMKLEDLEQFTLKNKHLPNVPSAEDMVKEGLDVGKTSKMFMEKIEELTLYLIEMNKEIKALKAENEALKKK